MNPTTPNLQEKVDTAVGPATITRLADEYGIGEDDVKKRIQTFFDTKASLALCSNTDNSISLEDFFPTRAKTTDSIEKTYDAAAAAQATATTDKHKTDAMRAMHDALRAKLGMPPITWTH